MRHREFGAPAKVTPRALIRRGRGGSAPTERTSEGGWVGQSGAQRTLLRDGGVGGPARYPRVPIETAPHRRHALALGASLRPRRLLARRAAERPHPHPLPRGEGAGTPSGVRCAREGHAACADPAGAWGRSPHSRHALALAGGAAGLGAREPLTPTLSPGERGPERHREFGASAKATLRALIRRGRGGAAPT